MTEPITIRIAMDTEEMQMLEVYESLSVNDSVGSSSSRLFLTLFGVAFEPDNKEDTVMVNCQMVSYKQDFT